PNAVAGGQPLRVNGPIAIAGGPEGNGCAVFQAGAPEQFMTTDGPWELTREPGHAIELWVLADGLDVAALVGMIPPKKFNIPKYPTWDIHASLVELMVWSRQSLGHSATVQFLHHWPLDLHKEDNLFSKNHYVPRHWHHIVAQK